MINGKFPQAHYEMLNDIHASKAFRQVVGHHHFTKAELDEISWSVGDFSAHNAMGTSFTPNWDKDAQSRLVAATVEAMAKAFPYVADE